MLTIGVRFVNSRRLHRYEYLDFVITINMIIPHDFIIRLPAKINLLVLVILIAFPVLKVFDLIILYRLIHNLLQLLLKGREFILNKGMEFWLARQF